MRIFVTAIGTDSGKTVFSAILTQALEADYWKPVQAGRPTDTDIVRSLVINDNSRFFAETYLLNAPLSPHASAIREGVLIDLNKFDIPHYRDHLVIEGAGGLMVPLNDDDMIVDLIPTLEAKTILVANLYLGSINHTLLSVELLEKKKIRPLGIVFNGQSNPESEDIIQHKSGYRVLLRIRPELEITPQVIQKYAYELKSNWPKEPS